MSSKGFKVFGFIFVGVLIITAILGIASNKKKVDKEPIATYDCDVKNFAFKTKIVVSKDGEEIGTISGNILKFFTDPLKFEKDGETIAYASDDYEIIGQDNHAIVSNGEIAFIMKGGFDLVGNNYTLLNKDKNEIAHIRFNAFNTGGVLYDNDDNPIAEYNSPIIFNDYTVRVYSDVFDENALLLLFGSYYSDQHYDDERSSKNN